MKYRKKPVIVEAIQWRGENFKKIHDWGTGFREITQEGSFLYIETLEGVMSAHILDWIIKGINGEIYPCKPDIFEKTYEAVGGEA